MGFSSDDPTKATTYEVESKPMESNVIPGYAILKAAGKPGSKFGHLNPATRPIKLNDQLFLAHMQKVGANPFRISAALHP
jgi:hypothetical protein